jgi:two-component system chemotaxis response regulator CheY
MKRVLSIGQCGFDHGQISAMLRREFGAETVAAQLLPEAEHLLQGDLPALILVNRVLDFDGGDGLEIIRRLQSGAATKGIPVMLVSNYPEAQAEAGTYGAKPGFGKKQLSEPATLDKLRPFLG